MKTRIQLVNNIKQERYSRVLRLSDTVTQLKGPKRNGNMQAAKRN